MSRERGGIARVATDGRDADTGCPEHAGVQLHLITCEYPPQLGGVSDFASTLANELSMAGCDVHVWAPGRSGLSRQPSGVVVHRELGGFSSSDMRRMGGQLDSMGQRHTLLLQWVPHGFGFKAMNLGFCLWILRRVRQRGDVLDLMVHEPFLPLSGSSPRVRAAGMVQRLMMWILLHAATRIRVSTESWIPRLRPLAPAGAGFTWLPIPSGVVVHPDAAAVRAVRASLSGASGVVLGHFGTYGDPTMSLLHLIAPAALRACASATLLLMGRGSSMARDVLARANPGLDDRIKATGLLDDVSLSHHLQSCDVMIQPYPDGVSTRRTSVMAALAHGLPTVTTTGELTEDRWAANGATMLAKTGDTQAFVSHVSSLLDDSSLRSRLGTTALRVYRDTFAAEHAVATMLRRESAAAVGTR